MNIFHRLKQDIILAGQQIFADDATLQLASIEIPKNNLNGDLSTNIAMVIAAKANLNPKEIAAKFKELMSGISYIAHLEIAGPGFINFTIKADKWQSAIRHILSHDPEFTNVKLGHGQKVNVEYVSANPTGPMHIGHARCAVYGDALARILSKCGFDVTKEYYVNDAGSQIADLTNTVILRYEEALTGNTAVISAGLYPGEYLKNVGIALVAKFGDSLMHMNTQERYETIKEFAVLSMLDLIKKDLQDLGVEHDIFFAESTLHRTKEIDIVVKQLKDSGLIYKGILPQPKGKIDANWQEREQLLFKSTAFGDDQDRPIQKADGSWSYFAPDIAYVQNKVSRGFNHLIYILGADHGGYIKRMHAAIQAVGHGKIKSDIKVCQLVQFVEDGANVKMSKRSGNFTTIREVIEEVGVSIIRFMMLTRKNDAVLDFDIAAVKEQSKDNPVFYVQYAYVRTVSTLSKAASQTPLAYEKFLTNQFDLSLLASEEEIEIIKLMASWPKILEGAATNAEPHRIAFYLLNLAAKFHAMWNLGKENNDYRFIIENDIETTAARIAFVKSIQIIIAIGFDLIGIEPVEKM